MMPAVAAAVLACPNLAVPAQLMYHVAEVESNFNRYAIGVVGGRLLRQPENLAEAIATARMLESGGYNFSLGISQVNRANLRKHGLDTYAKAFDICNNAVAGSQILQQCYANAGGQWGKAFSCYYSGNHTTGFRDGYVQKMYAVLGHGGAGRRDVLPAANAAAPEGSMPNRTPRPQTPGSRRDSAAHRISIRSLALDVLATATIAPAPRSQAGAAPSSAAAIAIGRGHAVPAPTGTAAPVHPAAPPGSAAFRPRVTGPGDRSAPALPTPAQPPPPDSPGSVPNTGDGAFVF